MRSRKRPPYDGRAARTAAEIEGDEVFVAYEFETTTTTCAAPNS